MEKFKGSKEQAKEPEWHKEIDWSAPDKDRQIALLYSQTITDRKDRPGFNGLFHQLTKEFAATHRGAEGDKIFAAWMITRMREAFPDADNDNF
jgi:hypothetical protein